MIENNESNIKIFNDKITYKQRFYLFMNFLLFNFSDSRFENICLFIIYYLQILSYFFNEKFETLDKENNFSDKILAHIYKIIRVGKLVSKYSKGAYEITIYIISIYYFLTIIIFIIGYFNINIKSSYTELFYVINCIIKFNFFILNNITIELFGIIICQETNYFINEYKCDMSNIVFILMLNIFNLIIGVFIYGFFIQNFMKDSIFLSNSYYSQINTNYWNYMILNNIFICVSLRLFTSKILFFGINIIISIIFFIYFIKNIIFYDKIINIICGSFHLLYIWSALYFLIISYIECNEKGFIYFIGCILICLIYYNLYKKFFINLMCNKPFTKLKNKSHLLFYLKNIFILTQNNKESFILNGILKLHKNECKELDCLIINKKKIYLPSYNKWSEPLNPFNLDIVYLNYLIVILMDHIIKKNYYNIEMLINLAFYYLIIIDNKCKSIYIFEKLKNFKMNLSEKFLLERLKISIFQKLKEKLCSNKEQCKNFKNLDLTYYFKYNYYENLFYLEIKNDLKLSEEFWKIFSKKYNDSIIDFNKVFKHTEKIMNCKNKIKEYWNILFNIYSGINENFYLYIDYVEKINDDTFLKRNLEEIKKKNENSIDNNINNNYNNLLFSPDLCICLCNGNKGKEGEILEINKNFEKIFNYSEKEIINKNISNFMPKIFSLNHQKYIKNYIEVGQKNKIINNKELVTYANDRENNLIKIKIFLKIFPLFEDGLNFIAMIFPEKIDDLILIDKNFNINGMSKSLKNRLNFKNNDDFFINYEIPFYIICKNFINFYYTFMKGNKINKFKKIDEKKEDSEMNYSENDIEINDDILDDEEYEIRNTNIEITENYELEYEIIIPNFILKFLEIPNKPEFTQIYSKKTIHKELKFTNDSFDETSKLLEKQKKIVIFKNDTFSNQTPFSKKIETIKTSPFIQEEEIFFNKLEKYRNFFNSEQFNELENCLDEDNKENSFKYKFNFTFQKINFGFNEEAYIIRCIDVLSEHYLISYSNIDLNLTDDTPNINSISKKLSEIRKEKEITLEEKNMFNENILKYFDNLKDNNYLKYINIFKEEIKKFSRVHGELKQKEMMIDENSSQTSMTGYNSGLSKINKILEIRENIINNSEKFYLLKYLIIIPIIHFIISLLFGMITYVYLRKLYNYLLELNSFQSNIYTLLYRETELVTVMLSLRLEFLYSMNNMLDSYNSFIEDKNEYYQYIMDISMENYRSTIKIIGEIEKNLSKFSDNTTIVWKKYPVNYYSINLTDDEPFPFMIYRGFVAANSLKYLGFTLDLNYLTVINDDLFNEIMYLNYATVESFYDINLPASFDLLKEAIILFKKFNKSKVKIISLIIIFNFCFVFICIIVYIYVILKTNKFMESGFKKILKISQDNIIEIINNIKNFKDSYYKNFNQNLFNVKNNINRIITTNIETGIKNEMIKNLSISEHYNLEQKKTINLRLHNKAYYHSVFLLIIDILYLILIYVIFNIMIKSNEDIIDIQNFVFGRYLIVSSSIVYIKCLLYYCSSNNLDYTSFFNKKLAITLYKNLKYYDKMNYYYNNYFLLNACGACFDIESEEYNTCMNDIFPQSLNNTDAFLDFILEKVTNIGNMIMNNVSGALTAPYILCKTTDYMEMEKAYYLYISPTIPRFRNVIYISFCDVFNKCWDNILLLIFINELLILLVIFYIKFIFLSNIKEYLSVSKSIVKIIPTNVIINNGDIETFIENIQNKI